MTSNVHPPTDPTSEPKSNTQKRDYASIVSSSLIVVVGLTLGHLFTAQPERSLTDPSWTTIPAPLVKRGGNPYIRALMRTISAAESNSNRPYSLLYGGEHFKDFNRHPDQCVTIISGPNQGDCTTAAGRYQFITTTWLEKASQYHSRPTGFWQKEFSFAPEYQDEVVYDWLSDPTAWGVDLADLLQQDRLEEVLARLSATWTSLGYGIEPNSMTDLLPEIYQQVLKEELRK